MKNKNLAYIIFLMILLSYSCSEKKDINNELLTENTNTLRYEIDFPSTVYTNKMYKGKITFHNKFMDSIAVPRQDTANFRFIIYKPYEPYFAKNTFNPIYGDSILLNNNIIDIELEFDTPGIYNVGGLARDAMRINYYDNFGGRDSARFIEHEIIILKKVVVKDSL